MPESDDEYAVICDVDVLVTKIKRAEIYFDTEMDAEIRKRIRANESPEVRLTKWQSRLTNLQKLCRLPQQFTTRVCPAYPSSIRFKPVTATTARNFARALQKGGE